MKKADKKLIAIMTSIAILVASGFNYSFSTFVQAEENLSNSTENIIIETDDLNTFSDEVTELYDKYELDDTSKDKDFQSARLLVESTFPIEDKEAVEIISGYGNYYVIQYEDAQSAKEAYETFLEMEQVICVQPDRVIELENESTSMIDISTEEKQEYLSWGTEKTGIDDFHNYIKENYENLPQVTVAVLDTGIDTDLNIFQGRILTGGKNFSIGSAKEPEDDNGHGTMVSTIIANNTFSNVKILPIKVMDRKGEGYDSQIMLGISYALEYGVDIINMSIGGDGEKSIYSSIFDKAAKDGIAMITAAGNEGEDVNTCTPANISSAISISAVDENDVLSNFSNYGDKIDFTAPGHQIVTLGINGTVYKSNGTSFATPFVTSAFSLIKSVDYEKDSNDIYNILKQHVADIGTEGWDTSFGYGRIELTGLVDYYKNQKTENTNPGNSNSNNEEENENSDKDNSQENEKPQETDKKIDGYSLGDVNQDFQVNVVDAYVILQNIIGKSDFSPLQCRLADIDEDGQQTVFDVFMILQKEVSGNGNASVN